MIYIDKSMVTPAGVAVSHHMVAQASVSSDGLSMNLIGHAWPSADQRVEGYAPAERWSAAVPIAALASGAGLLSDIATWLITFGPLVGGSIVPPESISLEDAKTLHWSEIKRQRSEIEYGGFVWDGSTFDSDETSRGRIQGAVSLALIAQGAGQPFSIDWTLADNTTRTLSGEEMIAVGLALGTHVATAFEIARQLREQIDAATTLQEVFAVVWPA